MRSVRGRHTSGTRTHTAARDAKHACTHCMAASIVKHVTATEDATTTDASSASVSAVPSRVDTAHAAINACMNTVKTTKTKDFSQDSGRYIRPYAESPTQIATAA